MMLYRVDGRMEPWGDYRTVAEYIALFPEATKAIFGMLGREIPYGLIGRMVRYVG